MLTLNQIKFCEIHGCQPKVEWGPYPACKYEGVRYTGRTPFFDKRHGDNAFEYYFEPICDSYVTTRAVPAMTCEQREQVHRQLPWAVRTYYYGQNDPRPEPGSNITTLYDERWYGGMRSEGHRLLSSYVRLRPHITAKLERLTSRVLRPESQPPGPVIGIHLRGTDKGKYMQTAGSGAQVTPSQYMEYLEAFLKHHPNASAFVATDSPSFLAEVSERWPRDRVRWRSDVLRDERNVAFSGSGKNNFRKGEEVLLDSLLLSRCDFLLHAASGVAETAMYWNPLLHNRSVHLQYTKRRQRPDWFPPP